MKYKILGNTGIKVSELCLGTMTFGTDWNFGADKKVSKQVFDIFTEAGGNFFDTANIYTKGSAETLLGEFIQSERDNLVVASKFSLSEAGKLNRAGNSRKNMVESIEGSLKRLKTDYIDLYYVHAWDFFVAPQEMMRTLEYLVSSGKVLTIGVSDTPAWVTAKCNTIAELQGWSSFAAYQVEYCLSERTAEREIIPLVENDNMLFAGFGPLGAGLLTGKYLHEPKGPRRMDKSRSHRLSEKNLLLSEKLLNFANTIGRTPSQVAIRWTMQKTKNSSPIFGARSVEQVKDDLGVLDFVLTKDQMNELDAMSAIGPNNPNDFLQLPRITEILYGNQKDKILR